MVPRWVRTAGAIRGSVAVICCLVSAMTAVPAPSWASAPPERTGHGAVAGSKLRTRFVIGLERSADPRVQTLSNPSRVVIDLPEMGVHLPAFGGEEPIGLVKSFRGGLAAADKFRVVIDVTEPVVVEKSAVERSSDGKAQHLVLDLVPANKPFADPMKAGAPIPPIQPPLPRPAERPEVRAAKSFKRTIVLDPGHGGMDSGAVRNGTIEKDVVLAFSLVLRDRLLATGRYNVLMTRDTDKFIPLDERRDFGERNNAGLFMAIHADSAGSRAQGATVYSLREGVANSLKNSARGEVVKSVLTDKDLAGAKLGLERDTGTVRSFLSDLAEREVLATRDRTNVITKSIVEYMGSSTPMQSNPDRTAAFRVLKTAKMPSVLVELAFVTNREDAARLKSDEWRAKVAQSLLTAIDAYFYNPATSPLR